MGVSLSDEAAAAPEVAQTLIGDFKKKVSSNDPNKYAFDDHGNYISDGAESDARDLITGTADADLIKGLGGNDALLGRAGDDSIEGGPGIDVLQGGTGTDTLDGGDGDDILYGSSMGNLTYPATVDFQPPPPDFRTVLAQGFGWWLTTNGSADVDGIPKRFLNATVQRDAQMDDSGNVIDGGIGNDLIISGPGADQAEGGEGQDLIYGMGATDVLWGDAGDDVIYGDGPTNNPDGSLLTWAPADTHATDFIDGGEGNDTMLGQGGDDEVWGDDGNDMIYGDDRDTIVTPVALHGSDYIDGEAGDDTLFGGGTDDELYGGSGSDVMYGDDSLAERVPEASQGDDFLDGEEGNDRLIGGAKDDQLFGGTGDDVIWADDGGHIGGEPGSFDPATDGNDYADGEEGNDVLLGEGGSDQLFGGEGNDTLTGDDIVSRLPASFHGADALHGGDGDDSMVGGGGADTLTGGLGNDKLFGDADDVPVPNQGNDVLDGGAGNDSLRGFGGDDQLAGGEGNDTVQGEAGDDVVAGGDGDDDVQGGDGADIVAGDAGNDIVSGQAGSDTLAGGDGNDELQGGEDADVLTGDAGNDTLFGQAGDDALDGGAGNDTLQGGVGSDTLTGDGSDLLLGEDGNDVLMATGGAAAMDGGAGNDWLQGGGIMLGGLGDDTLVGWGPDVQGGAGNDTYVIEQVAGNVWLTDTQGVSDIRITGATAATMTMEPSMPLDFGQPIDTNLLRLTVGGLTLDTQGLLSGAIGTIEVNGRAYQAAELFGQTFIYEMSKTTGAAGAALQGGREADTLTSTGGGATLAGGAGDDTLTGSGGNNTYRYNANDGADTMQDAGGGTLVFGAGIGQGDLKLSTDTNAMVITVGAGAANSIHLMGFNAASPAQPTGVSTFKFADGSTLTQAQLIARGFDITGTAASESLQGTSLADRMTGGAGADTLAGHAGADVYTFNVGDGTDLIADGDTAAGTGDALVFGAGISPADIVGLRTGNDVTLVVSGTSDQVTLRGYFASNADTVEQIRFNDGTTWTSANVLAAVDAGNARDWTLTGDAGSNILIGLGGNDVLSGLGGNDTLLGGPGNDTLDGGIGDDSLAGGAGSDLYLVSGLGEQDRIDEANGGDAAGVDTVRMDAIASTQASFSIYGNDLGVMDATGVVRLVVANQYLAGSAANQVERFEFADGVVLTAQDVQEKLMTGGRGADWITGSALNDAMTGGWGGDTLTAGAGADTLHGNQGSDGLNGEADDDQLFGDEADDTLFGGDGNDTLDGGTGADRLDGGLGNDVYSYAAGQGMDIVTADAGGVDRVQLAPGITTANVTVHRISSPPASDLAFKGDSLVVQLNGGGDQLWIANYFDLAAPGNVETIRFADGTSWDYATVTAKLGTQGGTANTLTGTTKADTFTVDHTNDVINDTTTTDVDTVNASVGYRLPASGTVTNLTLTGSLDLFAVGTKDSADTLRGNTGSNRLEYLGGPSLPGDTLIGGAGDDVYVLKAANMPVNYNEPATMGGVVITELAGEGVDTVLSGYWSNQLPANAENLILTVPNTTDPQSFGYNPNGAGDYTHRQTGNAQDNLIDTTAYEELATSQSWYAHRTRPHFIGVAEFRLDGGAGADTLVGGRMSDTYVVDNPGDTVVETGVTQQGLDWSNDTVETPYATSLLTQYPNIENVTLAGSSPVGATGNARANRLDGSQNGAGNALTGGAGNDTYVVGLGDTVVERAGEGTDTVLVTSGASTHLADYANVESLRLQPGADSSNVYGTPGADTLTGNTANNQIWGDAGEDFLEDQSDDVLYVGWGSVIESRAAQDADVLFGGAGDDFLSSRGGVDTLDGGAGDDNLRVYYTGRSAVLRLGLGDGHDTFMQDAGAPVAVTVELKAGLGLDGVQFAPDAGRITVSVADGSSVRIADTNAVSLRLPDGTTFGAAEIDIMSRTSDRTTPTALADLLYGTPGADTINALAGNDIIYGAAGNDTLTGGQGADVYRFGKGFGQDLVDDVAPGGGGTDDGAIDTIEFDATAAVADIAVSQQLTSGSANLVLAIASTGDTLTIQREYAAGNAGAVEQVKFADGTLWDLATLKGKVTGTIGTEAADTMTAPATSYRLEGRGGNDTLTGGAGNDTLDGGTGADKLTGGTGNDTYYVDSLTDQVVEVSTGGTLDVVIAGVDAYVLPTAVERGQLAAGTANWSLTGYTTANTLVGNAGANRLDGGAGIDTLQGGAGNDLYIVDVATDIITEASGEGIDSVQAAVTFTLPVNVENLTLTGTATKLVATGNAGDNLLIGNSVANTLSGLAGNDRLDGGAGNDSMTGGAGNDTFVVDATGDTTVEAAAGGLDTVETNLTWTLGTEVEKLLLTGANAVNGTGNASINWLVGNTANNTLNGLAGADVLQGGAGTDTLTDTAGNGAFDGGAGNDVLTAGAGNDLLAGGIGNDTYTLGAGADIVAFDKGDGVDTIKAPLSGAGLGELNDVLSLGKIRLADINFSRETNDLVLRVTGTTDAIRFTSWYAATGDQTFTKLQVMVDSTADYQPGSTDALYASRITVLDFKQLVAGYDAARASNPALVNWSPQESLLHTARLTSSDSLAHGGNLAYRYAEDGALANVQYEGSTGELAAVGFVGTLQDILYGLVS
ncbi:calcium-binding protein [Caenimonas aquaedulcis]|uniref:calcium-binding protein n=1 Tax=Caenimonas aquaedulcis TaxID=2793270 RepID=UPI0025B65E7E|nr:calcium-binding protein [Caenimonas aquaedulcis]